MATRVNGIKGSVRKLPANGLSDSSVSTISKANPGEVTTTAAHGLENGMSVQLSGVVGMTEVNGKTFVVTVVSTTKFTIGVNTTNYATYISDGTVHPLGVNIPIKGFDWNRSVPASDATTNADDGYDNVTPGNKKGTGSATCLWDTEKEGAACPTEVEEGDEVILHLYPSKAGGYWCVPALITEVPVRVAENATTGWTFSFVNRGKYEWVPAA